MKLNKHVETVQLPDGELRVVQDDELQQVEVYESTEPDPIAVFGFHDESSGWHSNHEARIRGVEYANGYARAKGEE